MPDDVAHEIEKSRMIRKAVADARGDASKLEKVVAEELASRGIHAPVPSEVREVVEDLKLRPENWGAFQPPPDQAEPTYADLSTRRRKAEYIQRHGIEAFTRLVDRAQAERKHRSKL